MLRGEPNSSFSVLVSSPTAILYRLDRVDFRQIALKDPVIESLLRAEALELSARIDEANVRQDLAANAKWGRYRRELAAAVLAKHEQEHAMASFGQRSPDKNSHIRSVRRPLPAISSSKTSSSAASSPRSSNNTTCSISSSRSPPTSPPPSARSPRDTYNRRPSILVTTPTGSKQPVHNKKWLEVRLSRTRSLDCSRWVLFLHRIADTNPTLHTLSGRKLARRRSSLAKTGSASTHRQTRQGRAQARCVEVRRLTERLALVSTCSCAGAQSPKSHIHWSRTSKILGGLADDDDEDKVTSAIVSLFSRAEDAKRR